MYYVHAHTHTHTHTHIYIYDYTYTYIHIHMYLYIYIYKHKCYTVVYNFLNMSICTRAYIHLIDIIVNQCTIISFHVEFYIFNYRNEITK